MHTQRWPSVAAGPLLQYLFEEVDHELFVPGQLLIPWEIVDVNEVEQGGCTPRLISLLPGKYDVEIEEV